MKNLVITSIIALLVAGWSIAGAQNYPDEYLGLPGDNLNLYAVIKLFQESETLEDFERNLNNENTLVNNLDLNGDNMVDYIMVYDYVDGNVHNIVLRVAINQRETQDVAVFTVQQFNDGSVQVQLIGDELLYGKNYIVEPYYAENGATPNPGYVGNTRKTNKVTVVHTTTYQVAEWPIVRFIFLPSYVAWRSSWYWGYRPVYWNPWRPFYWHTYYGYHYHWHNHYYAHYRHWNHYRYPRYKNHYYTSVRTYSPRITVNINKGVYKTTYSRPDLRREGEKLYARRSSDRNSSTVRNSSTGRVRAASTSTVRSARTNSQNNVETRSAVRSSASQRSTTGVTQRNSAERKFATVRNSRSNTTSSVRQNSGATRNSSATSVRSATGNNSVGTGTGAAEIKTNRSEKSSSVGSPNNAVRSSQVNTPQRQAVTRQARTSTPQKSATISTRNNTSRSSVSNSGSNVSSKSAPKVSTSRSTPRQSTPSVSRSSSSARSGAATKSGSARNSSARSSGRR